jgi:hypothetical protein
MIKTGAIDENTPQPEAEKPVKAVRTKEATDKVEDSAATRLAKAAEEQKKKPS